MASPGGREENGRLSQSWRMIKRNQSKQNYEEYG